MSLTAGRRFGSRWSSDGREYDVRRGTFVVNVPVASATPLVPTMLRVLTNFEALVRQ